jgi:thiol-disulfide isomerase/thioredoxin
MKKSMLLYTAIAACAIVGIAAVALKDPAQPVPSVLENRAELEALRTGDMKKLQFHEVGAPCRKEMPMLAELQTELGGDAFEVVTIATGRNAPQAMQAFFDEIGVTNLPLHNDTNSGLARAMGVLGLPATLIVAPDGHEIARLQGDADWASDSANRPSPKQRRKFGANAGFHRLVRLGAHCAPAHRWRKICTALTARKNRTPQAAAHRPWIWPWPAAILIR